MGSDFLNKIQDIINVKYPDIVAKYEEIVSKTALALGYLDTASTKATEAYNSAGFAAADALDVANMKASVLEKEGLATTAATTAAVKASEAKSFRDELVNINPSLVMLASSEGAYLSYNPATGQFIIGMPQGLKGDRGEAFNVDASGTIANRTTYNGATTGFAYLTLDENPTMLYFKASDTSGDWSAGVAFGKGNDGVPGAAGVGILDISKTATVGTVDTYTITFTNGDETTYEVANGDVSSVAGKSGDVTLDKDDVGLENVDNTSDSAKPVSTDQATAIGLKATKIQTHTTSTIYTDKTTGKNYKMYIDNGKIVWEEVA